MYYHKKINVETMKVGKKCTISFKGNDINHVTYMGKKNKFYLFKDNKKDYLVYPLTLLEAKRMCFVIVNK